MLAHGRSEERLAALADELPGARTFRADLAALADVAALAEEVRAATDRLDVLLSNAGIGFTRARRRSAPGERGRPRAALRRQLPRRLRADPAPAAAPAGLGAGAVVQVASAGQAPIDFDDPMLERDYDGVRAYRQSKLAQIMLAFDLAHELDGAEVTATALHPGTFMPTKMVTGEGIAPLTPLEHGVDATWRLVADPALDGVTGLYFDQTRQARPEAQALDADARRALRELSARLTGV